MKNSPHARVKVGAQPSGTATHPEPAPEQEGSREGGTPSTGDDPEVAPARSAGSAMPRRRKRSAALEPAQKTSNTKKPVMATPAPIQGRRSDQNSAAAGNTALARLEAKKNAPAYRQPPTDRTVTGSAQPTWPITPAPAAEPSLAASRWPGITLGHSDALERIGMRTGEGMPEYTRNMLKLMWPIAFVAVSGMLCFTAIAVAWIIHQPENSYGLLLFGGIAGVAAATTSVLRFLRDRR